MDTFDTSLGLGAWLAIASMILLYNHYPQTPLLMVAAPFVCITALYCLFQTAAWSVIIGQYTLSAMFRLDILLSFIIIVLVTAATYTIISVANLIHQHTLSLAQGPSQEALPLPLPLPLPVGGSSCED